MLTTPKTAVSWFVFLACLLDVAVLQPTVVDPALSRLVLVNPLTVTHLTQIRLSPSDVCEALAHRVQVRGR